MSETKPVWWQSPCGGKARMVVCALAALSGTARAGHWDIIAQNAPHQPTVTRWADVRDGTTSGYSEDDTPTHRSSSATTPYIKLWGNGTGWPNYSYRAEASHGGRVGGAMVDFNGTARSILVWKPNQINGVDDTNDKPPLFVAVSLVADVHAKTWSQTIPEAEAAMIASVHAQGSITKEADTESVIALEVGQVLPEYNDMAQTGDPGAVATIDGRKHFLLVIPVNNRTEIVVPGVHLRALSTLDGGREWTYYYYGIYPSLVKFEGSASAGVIFTNSDAAFQLTPDPAALALMDCAHPELSVVNQYVMSGAGGVPFTIDCLADFGPIANGFDNPLRAGFSWEIERAPLPMLAAAPNGFSATLASNGPSIWRRSYPPDPASPIPGATPTPGPTPLPTATPSPNSTPTPTATPIDGMGFDTRGGLPASNDAFGLNKIFHRFAAPNVAGPPPLIATADIALFYDAGAKTHPDGGPLGYFHTFSAGGQFADHNVPWPTSNWIYYYDQVWKNKWGIPVVYWTGDGSYWWVSDPSHLHIGNEAHGLSSTPTDLFAIPSTGTVVQHIGSETTRGIDTYIRVVTHEAVHSRLAAINVRGVNDNELDSSGNVVGDGIPDAMESQVGLDPTNHNTANFPGGDDEVFARMCEYNLFATATQVQQDWADDGLNKGTPPPPNLCQRTFVSPKPPFSNLSDPAIWTYPPNALSLVP